MTPLYTITGKHENGVLLMIPIYNPNIGEYLSRKYIEDTNWKTIVIKNPQNRIIYSR